MNFTSDFADSWQRYFSTDSITNDPRKEYQSFFLGFFTLAGLFIISFGILFSLFNGLYQHFYVFTGSLLILLIARLSLSPFRHPSRLANIYSPIIALNLLYSFYFSESIPYGWIWFIIFPFFSLMLYGIKKGIYFSLILAILVIPGFIFPAFFNQVNNDHAFLLTFLGSYLLSLAGTSLFFQFTLSIFLTGKKQIKEHQKEKREKNHFISELSHQLRTSLSNILLVNTLISKSDLNKKEKDLIDTLQASTNNLIESVNKMVDISHSEMTMLNENKTRFDLFKTLSSITELFRNTENLKIDFRFKGEIDAYLMGTPIRLKQTFLSLIQNLLIGSEKISHKIEIEAGIYKETNNTLTLKFRVLDICQKIFVSNSSTDENEPMLPEIKLDYFHDIIGEEGNELTIHFEGNRRIISFLLNFEKEKIFDDKSKEEQDLFTTEKKRVPLKDAEVLLVEDNIINQKIVLLSLQKIVKNVDVAANGKEALDKFGTSRYDIILMDIQMPVMDGILATRKIREIETSTSTNTPIIAITANALSGDRENCLAVGMNDYISKPFQAEILIQKMKSLLKDKQE